MSRQGIGLSLFRQQGGRDLGTRDRPRRGSATPRARDSIDLSLRGPDNAAMTSARRSSARSLRLLLPAARVILAAAFALALAGCVHIPHAQPSLQHPGAPFFIAVHGFCMGAGRPNGLKNPPKTILGMGVVLLACQGRSTRKTAQHQQAGMCRHQGRQTLQATQSPPPSTTVTIFCGCSLRANAARMSATVSRSTSCVQVSR